MRARLRSISHRCHLFEVAFVWESTTETIHLPLGCLQGGWTTLVRGPCLGGCAQALQGYVTYKKTLTP